MRIQRVHKSISPALKQDQELTEAFFLELKYDKETHSFKVMALPQVTCM